MHHPFKSRGDAVVDRCLPQATISGSRLETLPNEILEPIFRLACTDGGRTGCSLALVSKTIRVASRSSRFHSVSLLSGICTQLERFGYALEAAKVEARAEGAPEPRVRHLCITLTPAFDRQQAKKTKLDDAHEDHRTTLERLPPEVLEATRERTWNSYCTLIQSLFCAVCADLETACLFRRIRYLQFQTPSFVCPGGFPRLRELTFDHAMPPFACPPDNVPCFPALRRLHMLRIPDCLSFDFQAWAVHAPHLAWLRITTSLYYPDASFRILPSLALALNRPPETPRPSSRAHSRTPRPPCFTELDTLLIMVNPRYLKRHMLPAYIAYAAELSAAAHALGVPFTFLHPAYNAQDVASRRSSYPMGALEEGMLRDWLLRLEGGEGVFTVVPLQPKKTLRRQLRKLWRALRARVASGGS